MVDKIGFCDSRHVDPFIRAHQLGYLERAFVGCRDYGIRNLYLAHGLDHF
jgi:hypothetical protein